MPWLKPRQFRARVSVNAGMGKTWDRRPYHITNTEYGGTLLLSQLNGCHGISRLSRLRYSDHQVFFTDDRVAVPELGSIFHLNWHARVLFFKVFTYQSRMPCCAACYV